MLLLPAEHRQDPAAFYACMRREQPVWLDEADGTWSVFRHAAVRTVLKDFQRFGSDPAVLTPLPAGFDPNRPSLIRLDPPDHRRLRARVAPTFTPARIARLAPTIAALAHGMVDGIVSSGRMDVIEDLAFPLPVTVIAELLGVPPSDRAMYKRWADRLLGRRQRFQLQDPIPEEARQAMQEMDAYFSAVVRERRRRPQNDLISEWAAPGAADALSDAELINLCALMLLAGHVTTVNLIGNAVWTLLEWPEQLARLRRDPDLLSLAIEEVLRFRGPVPAVVRFTRVPVTIGAETIPAGKMVVAWIGSANLDETVFPEPERFDVTRNPREHLAFGSGIHVCLGAPLARLEGQIALSVLLERLHDLSWLDPDVRRQAGQRILYGLDSLPIAFRERPLVAA
jgi:cytochrome P450